VADSHVNYDKRISSIICIHPIARMSATNLPHFLKIKLRGPLLASMTPKTRNTVDRNFAKK